MKFALLPCTKAAASFASSPLAASLQARAFEPFPLSQHLARNRLSSSVHFVLSSCALTPVKMSGLSLWLSPSPSSPLAPFLARLSSTLQTVAFAPHATLVSDEIVPSLELGDLKSRIEEGVARWRESQTVGEEQPTKLALAFKDVRQGEL